MAGSQLAHPGFVALMRFGYGARGDGDLAAAASDPRGFLKAEISQPSIALLEGADLKATPALVQALFAEQDQRKMERERQFAEAGQAKSMASGAPAIAPTPAKPLPKPRPVEQQAFRAEALARFQRAAGARAGLVERLVAFWSNHFCISVGKSQLTHIAAGAFEREAIRPHVFGRFADMLKAVVQHPAMLVFLDNQQSVGPNSKAGRNRQRGLNENLAREIMELHCLGVNGGYSQADVTALARILTGWTLAGREGRLGQPGSFIFNSNAHEPGDHVLMNKAYVDHGLSQGETALADLAQQPACARFIALKFARHFIADAPPAALVDRLAEVLRTRDGDLRAMTLALLDDDEGWAQPLTKLRNPYEFLIASARMGNHTPDNPDPVLGALNLMGMALWQPPGPDGWPDTVAAWVSPEGMKQRLDMAAQISSRWKDIPNPLDLLMTIAGDAASPDTRQSISRAESRQQGLALLLMSPEFQRR